MTSNQPVFITVNINKRNCKEQNYGVIQYLFWPFQKSLLGLADLIPCRLQYFEKNDEVPHQIKG